MATKTVNWTGGARAKKILGDLSLKLGTGAAVQVGFFADSRYTSSHPLRGTPRKPLPVAQVAFWNIYGTTKTPARDFMGVAIRGHQANYGKDLAAIAKFTGYDTKRTMAIMGERIQGQIVKQIVQWSQPPNSPRTVAIKGFNKPLIDDGTMQREVGYAVNGGTVVKGK